MSPCILAQGVVAGAIAPTAASDPSQTCQPDYRHAATVTHGCRGCRHKNRHYSMSQRPPPLRFSDIFPKRLGIFNKFFTHLLCVPNHARLQIFIQLYATLTKLCHTNRDPAPIEFFIFH